MMPSPRPKSAPTTPSIADDAVMLWTRAPLQELGEQPRHLITVERLGVRPRSIALSRVMTRAGARPMSMSRSVELRKEPKGTGQTT